MNFAFFSSCQSLKNWTRTRPRVCCERMQRSRQSWQSIPKEWNRSRHKETSIRTESRMTIHLRQRRGATQQQARQEVEQGIIRRMTAIDKESQKDPQQGINDALMLPLQDAWQNNSPRAQALLMVARNSQKKKPTLAKSALDEISKFEDQLTPAQLQGIADVPKIYLDLGDEDGAKKSLKAMVKAAEKLYAHDADADDPNRAF